LFVFDGAFEVHVCSFLTALLELTYRLVLTSNHFRVDTPQFQDADEDDHLDIPSDASPNLVDESAEASALTSYVKLANSVMKQFSFISVETDKAKTAGTYGACTPQAMKSFIHQLMRDAKLNADSVFMDAGAGLHLPGICASTLSGCHSCGIEKDRMRSFVTLNTLQTWRTENPNASEAITQSASAYFYGSCDDLTGLDGVTHLYCYDSCWSAQELEDLMGLFLKSRTCEYGIFYHDGNASASNISAHTARADEMGWYLNECFRCSMSMSASKGSRTAVVLRKQRKLTMQDVSCLFMPVRFRFFVNMVVRTSNHFRRYYTIAGSGARRRVLYPEGVLPTVQRGV
jgi:hypothetical protein